VENESYLLEILNNIDKIIYRGQVHREIETFWDKTSQAIDKAMEFYSHLEIYGIAMHLIVIGTIIVLCGMLIQFYFAKKICIIFFITFLTMILLYREKMLNFVQMVPDFVEFVGRTRSVLKHFKEIHRRAGAIQETPTPAADNPSLEFREIRFEKVSFKYKTGDYLFRQTDLTLKTDQHRIIGITGLSGRGKSTFIKLILKMYRCEEGRIYIDGVDIGDLDANYIRANVTYVSQSAKLFDTKVVDNMMYGCIQDDACKAELERIMQYPKIRELYKNVDIYQAQAGALGENLSGGQRQVANIIGGLINPSKILILDEPTNALDAQLKQEVLALIGQYKDRKQAMVIITHDRDVYPLFSENIVL
jgi:ABC-type bacteriocin/lantibiotic exporter with double-glycine peptidase domain